MCNNYLKSFKRAILQEDPWKIRAAIAGGQSDTRLVTSQIILQEGHEGLVLSEKEHGEEHGDLRELGTPAKEMINNSERGCNE